MKMVDAPRVVALAAAVVPLVGTSCWLATDFSWEPALAAFGALLAYGWAIHKLAHDQFKMGMSRQVTELALEDVDGKFTTDALVSSILSLTNDSVQPAGALGGIFAGAFGVLLRRLGLVRVGQSGRLEPVSRRAGLFLDQLALSIEQGVPFAGDWEAVGTQNPRSRKLGDLLETIESFRIEASGGVENTKPVRRVSSSLVLVKSMRGAEPVILMRWSESWGGYFWFIGGVQESKDASSEACARRELQEEVGVLPGCVISMGKLMTVDDCRISARERVLTVYEYSLFSVALRDEHPACLSLRTHEFNFEKTVSGGYRVNQRCKWMSWAEIKGCPDLNRDAGAVIEAIERFGIDRVPLSLKDEIV